MASTVAEMTKEELRDMMASLIEEKLLDLVGDPDEDSVFRTAVRERLLRQKRAVQKGERGESLEKVAQRLGLA